MMLRVLLIALSAYLLGSVSSSVLISRHFFAADVRGAGSGNAGATNMARVYGFGPGLAVLACDAVKTILALLLGRWLGGTAGVCVAGVCCNLGHCKPLFFGFSGGKGVSVGAAIAAFLGWRIFAAAAAVFFLLFALTKIVSVCSMAAAVAIPLMCVLTGAPLPYTLLAVFTALLVLWFHRGNLARLRRGEEPKFHAGK